MNRVFLFLLVAIIHGIVSCSSNDFNQIKNLSANELDSLLFVVSVYTEKEPDEYDYEFADRWKVDNYNYYKERASKLTLTHYHHDSINRVKHLSFMKHAPSLYEEFRATGCELKYNDNDSVIMFKILYVTPRASKDSVNGIVDELFPYMVQNKNVAPFLSDLNKIEWPTEKVFFDTTQFDWKILP